MPAGAGVITDRMWLALDAIERNLRARASYRATFIALDVVHGQKPLQCDVDKFELLDERAKAAAHAMFNPTPVVIFEVRP